MLRSPLDEFIYHYFRFNYDFVIGFTDVLLDDLNEIVEIIFLIWNVTYFLSVSITTSWYDLLRYLFDDLNEIVRNHTSDLKCELFWVVIICILKLNNMSYLKKDRIQKIFQISSVILWKLILWQNEGSRRTYLQRKNLLQSSQEVKLYTYTSSPISKIYKERILDFDVFDTALNIGWNWICRKRLLSSLDPKSSLHNIFPLNSKMEVVIWT